MGTHMEKMIQSSAPFVFTILCFSSYVYGQKVEFKDVKPIYPFKGKFEFEIISNSDTTIHYNVSLEVYMNDSSWREIRTDLFINHYSRKARIFSIERGKTSDHYFNLDGPLDDVDTRKYRIKMEYYRSYNEKREIAYSQIFTIPR
jgi:hypothetical protein